MMKMRNEVTAGKEQHARIVVTPPGPKAQEFQKKAEGNISHVMYSMHPGFFEKRAFGSLIEDVDGNTYIDFLGGVGVNLIGNCHPKVVEAIVEQAPILMSPNNHVALTELYIDYAIALKSTLPAPLNDGGVFLGNSGTEAVEAALKAARQTSYKENIIGFRPSFHGRTMGSLALTTGGKGRKGLPAQPSVFHAPYPYSYRAPEGVDVTEWSIGEVEKILNDLSPPENTAAGIAETIAGEPGVIVPNPDYFKKLSTLLHDKGILWIADEVQMGFGKTGTYPWGFQHFDAVPDIVTFAKPAGGGLPLGGVVVRKDVDEKWASGAHASTNGGNPLAIVGGMAVMKIIKEENLLERGARTGAYILKRLTEEFMPKYPLIGEVRGKGMIVGIELVTDQRKKTPAAKEAADIDAAIFKMGLIGSHTGPYGNVLRFSPPLNISTELVDEGLDTLDKAFKEVVKR